MFLNAFVRTASMILCIKPILFFDHHPSSVLRSPANLECLCDININARGHDRARDFIESL